MAKARKAATGTRHRCHVIGKLHAGSGRFDDFADENGRERVRGSEEAVCISNRNPACKFEIRSWVGVMCSEGRHGNGAEPAGAAAACLTFSDWSALGIACTTSNAFRTFPSPASVKCINPILKKTFRDETHRHYRRSRRQGRHEAPTRQQTRIFGERGGGISSVYSCAAAGRNQGKI